jgi:hypothetical protein
MISPLYRDRKGYLNLRQASRKLGYQENWLADKCKERGWPQDVPTFCIAGKNGGVFFPETALDTVRAYYNQKKAQ